MNCEYCENIANESACGHEWIVKPQWISIKDRLPEVEIEVLIFCKSNGLGFYRIAHRPSNAHNMSVWKTKTGMLLNEVIDWQPLPLHPSIRRQKE